MFEGESNMGMIWGVFKFCDITNHQLQEPMMGQDGLHIPGDLMISPVFVSAGWYVSPWKSDAKWLEGKA